LKARQIAEMLIADPRSISLLWEADRIQQESHTMLEHQLETSLDYIAVSLYILACILTDIPEQRPPGLSESFWIQVDQLHQRATILPRLISDSMKDNFLALFKDCFQFREHVFDGPRIAFCLQAEMPSDLLLSLKNISTDALDTDFKLGQTTFREQLDTARKAAQRCIDIMDGPIIPKSVKLSPQERKAIQKVLDGQTVPLKQLQGGMLDQLQESWFEFYERLSVGIIGSGKES